MARRRAVVISHAPGLVGNALFRPFLERRHQAVLDHLLGEVEVAEDADQGRGQPAGLLAEDGG